MDFSDMKLPSCQDSSESVLGKKQVCNNIIFFLVHFVTYFINLTICSRPLNDDCKVQSATSSINIIQTVFLLKGRRMLHYRRESILQCLTQLTKMFRSIYNLKIILMLSLSFHHWNPSAILYSSWYGGSTVEVYLLKLHFLPNSQKI